MPEKFMIIVCYLIVHIRLNTKDIYFYDYIDNFRIMIWLMIDNGERIYWRMESGSGIISKYLLELSYSTTKVCHRTVYHAICKY